MRYENILKKITYKKIAVVMLVLFIIFLLPIIYCSFFDYANGDDLWEGAAAYRVLVNHGTFKDFIEAIRDQARMDYNGWEGNWSSIILWCLPPNIWGEKVYCITPWIALLSLCGGTTYFLFFYLKKYLKGNYVFLTIVSIIACFFTIQYMPNIRNGIYWYTGMINYIFPYGWCLSSFVWIDKFLETGKKRYCVFTAIVYAYVGGAGYPPIVFAFEILFSIIVFRLLNRKHRQVHRAFWLCLPLVLLVTGFIFSAISPGNAVRGGDSYYFSGFRVLTTIFESIKQGGYWAIARFFTVRPLVLVAPLLGIVAWEQIDIDKAELEFRHPVLVICFLFLVSCSVYAPGIYAQSEVSGGVPDTIYFIFLLSYIFTIIYLTCYFKTIYTKKGWNFLKEETVQKLRGFIVCGELLFCIVAGRYLVKNMASYICIDFIRTGQLKDFEYQMQERLKILNDPEITNAVVPEMNNEQGPFMHMALVKDPNCYTNYATARYYGKETVIALPRIEYYELFGYPENYEQ